MIDEGQRLRRAVRWFTCGSGPLKRGTDRLQLLSRLLLLVVVLVAAPTALWLGHRTHERLAAEAARQAAVREQVQAMVLEDTGPAFPGPGARSAVLIPAHWSTDDGEPRTGDVLVPSGTRAGEQVTVWVTDDGRLTSAPIDPSDGSLRVGVLTFIALVLAACGVHAAVVVLLDRHRARQMGGRLGRRVTDLARSTALTVRPAGSAHR